MNKYSIFDNKAIKLHRYICKHILIYCFAAKKQNSIKSKYTLAINENLAFMIISYRLLLPVYAFCRKTENSFDDFTLYQFNVDIADTGKTDFCFLRGICII